jgi:hypothetical protein
VFKEKVYELEHSEKCFKKLKSTNRTYKTLTPQKVQTYESWAKMMQTSDIENIFNKIIAGNFPNLVKNMVIHF